MFLQRQLFLQIKFDLPCFRDFAMFTTHSKFIDYFRELVLRPDLDMLTLAKYAVANAPLDVAIAFREKIQEMPD